MINNDLRVRVGNIDEAL
ncbi:Protein of unknown function [Bacillus mycoides]|nr:Protein of unknown function [Bacillus mycoides]SCC01521.1 Protein of unknown function [Bacillus mycoides]